MAQCDGYGGDGYGGDGYGGDGYGGDGYGGDDDGGGGAVDDDDGADGSGGADDNDDVANDDLYNSDIRSTQQVQRPGQWSGYDGFGFHEGTVATTDQGDFLLHNTPSGGGAGRTVVTSADDMSSKWKNVGEPKLHESYSVGDAMQDEASHGSYNLFSNNCMDTSKRVHSHD
ncbi:uncharacterized protein MONBRDRAFT_9113 [Monosiga brevicollis MX1]|uniref:Uncharacterized protein n=1 Tax=Monosiga brevicollis TaxID=81824 RepID=A9V245_MONBE|nr:uncharacterized protein MONBRDRAFT_9113 [Monosiga brevicollis MX1]EDQ88189.1 predicted protein [Monosiga brevicollis MX1]|eukprot:XP_001746782.1 hypothetical protein [Monosiga brevicollis MX1]